jgi:hypothetical protein
MEPRRIVSMDPWGHLVAETFQSEIADGLDLRPSIGPFERPVPSLRRMSRERSVFNG